MSRKENVAPIKNRANFCAIYATVSLHKICATFLDFVLRDFFEPSALKKDNSCLEWHCIKFARIRVSENPYCRISYAVWGMKERLESNVDVR